MTPSDTLKAAAKVALGILFLLLVGSAIFWKERMLFSDASFIAFRIINYGNLQMQVGRHGAFITQVFPWVASKAHLPLWLVLWLYSLSFTIFYFLTGWLLYRMRQYPLTILLAFYLSLYVSDTYFWTNNEVHQGVAWMLLDFGLLHYLYSRYGHRVKPFLLYSLPLFAVLTFIAIYTHPLVMITFLFLWMFWVLAKESFFVSKLSFLYLAIVATVCVLKYWESQNNWYDGGFVHNITHTTLRAVLQTFSSSLAMDFYKGALQNYWLLWLFFIVGLMGLYRQKKYRLLAYTILSCLGYFIMICLAFYPSKTFYIESEWMSLSILATAGFVYFVLPNMAANRAMLLLAVAFGIRLCYIGFASEKFTKRVQFLDHHVREMRQQPISKKIVLNQRNTWDTSLLLTWGLPYETLLLSAMHQDQPTVTMSYLKQEKITEYEAATYTKGLVSDFGHFEGRLLNPYYFQMDTVRPYTIVTTEE